MTLRALNYGWFSVFISVALLCGDLPVVAQPVQEAPLDAESIAASSLSVAQSMKSTGYCYAGVSKAMAPLGVSLTGEAAFQARDQLLADSRFTPVSLEGTSELQRGDILVFNKSASHPYGHISVYQGNNEESSDHVSKLTSPEVYGGVTVFRLLAGNERIASVSQGAEWSFRMPMTAPDFRQPVQPVSPVKKWQQKSRDIPVPRKTTKLGYGDTSDSGIVKRAVSLIDRHLLNPNSASSKKALKDKLIRFVMQNL